MSVAEGEVFLEEPLDATEAFTDAVDFWTVLPELELCGEDQEDDGMALQQTTNGTALVFESQPVSTAADLMQLPKDLQAFAPAPAGSIPAEAAATTPTAAAAAAAAPASAPATPRAALAQAASSQVRLPRSRQVLLRDKLAFVLGSSCLWVCAFWMGHHPSSFYILYSALGAVLFSARYVVYRKKKWHYYLLDYCYWSNALLLFHLWAAPASSLLARTTFAFNTGPLTASILAFRNSLVFHDMDKVTSLFLHLVPACVSWAQRWYAEPRKFGDAYSGSANLKQLLLVPLAFYTVWAALYVFTVFVLAADRIKKRGYVTLFTYVTTRQKGAFAAIARKVPVAMHVPVYLGLHMLFCAVSMLAAWAAWRSFVLHTCLLIAVSTLSIYHGASFYFEVFATRYHMAPANTPLSPPATPRSQRAKPAKQE